MNVITRGVRNAFRNNVRLVAIVAMLGFSIGLALVMLIARQAVSSKIDSVKSSIGNTITVSPAGSRGFAGGGNPLTAAQVAEISSTAHVVKVTSTLSDRLSTAGSTMPNFPGATENSNATTSLTSSIDAGSLGRRFGGGGGGDGGVVINGGAPANFSLPIQVTGTNDPTSTQVASSNQLKITSGSAIDGNSSADVAMVGTSLASKNNLSVGSTFQAYGKTITVTAIYDAGNTFANGGIIMPLATVQNLSGQPGDVQQAIVQVDSISNLSTTTSALQSKLGTNVADVVSSQDTSNQALAPLSGIENITLYITIGFIVLGAFIILLSMMMIVRERRREIGVLKAIGSSNLKVMLQFMTEAITFTLLAAVLGLVIGFFAANPVTQYLVTTSATSSANSAAPGGPGGAIRINRGFGGGFARLAGQGGTNLRTIHAAVGWSILLYGLLAAVIIAILGSAVPAFLIAKVRPAEVMRAE